MPRGGLVKSRKFQLIGALAIALTLVIAGIVLYWRAHRVAPVPPNLIPSSWEVARTSPGHTEHVGKLGLACKECHDYEKDGFKNPGSGPCTSCHQKQTSHSHQGDAALKT